MSFAEKMDERKLQPHHVFLASFLAGLNEMGMLNQASVNVAARRAGRYLAEFARARGDVPEPGPSPSETARRLIEHLNGLMDLSTMLEISSEAGIASCRIVSRGCKFCPKGVGEAELEGTLCPYPGLIEEFVNQLIGENQRMRLVMTNRRPMVKAAEGCLVQLE
jgi:hypothetical protein